MQVLREGVDLSILLNFVHSTLAQASPAPQLDQTLTAATRGATDAQSKPAWGSENAAVSRQHAASTYDDAWRHLVRHRFPQSALRDADSFLAGLISS